MLPHSAASMPSLLCPYVNRTEQPWAEGRAGALGVEFLAHRPNNILHWRSECEATYPCLGPISRA